MGSGRFGYCVHLLQLWFYSHLSVISRAKPAGFLRRNRVKIIVAFDLPFTGDTTAWLRYLFGMGSTDCGYGESSGELLGGRVGPTVLVYLVSLWWASEVVQGTIRV